MQTSNTIIVNQSIIDERNSQMDAITRDVHSINEIYKDLSLLVQEQGGHINTIADNIENTVHQTESALKEVQKADTYQRKSCSIS